MIEAEASLMANAAKMCHGLDQVLVKASRNNTTPAVQKLAFDNCVQGRSVLGALVQRYLRTL